MKETKKCPVCKTVRAVKKMSVCMDHRQMHIYVCDMKCMVKFYQ
jgi:hypothetical protein